MAQFQFNARNYQPATADGGNPPLPVGEWPMQVTSSELKQANSGNGGYLQLDVVIIDSEHKGHAGAWRINLYNQSEQTVQIAQRQLSALCHAIGVFDVTDTVQLHGKPFIGVVKPNPSEKYPNGTQIGGVKDIRGNDPGKAPQQPPAAPTGPAWGAVANVPPQPPVAPPSPPATANQWAPVAPAVQQQVPQQPAAPAWAPQATPGTAPPWANK